MNRKAEAVEAAVSNAMLVSGIVPQSLSFRLGHTANTGALFQERMTLSASQ